ncbi:MAG TPA: transporter substrate-binding domain-containing protein [Mycobacteriales bacterium]|nr:transporter substrate-binding domain-containing protein [Mycobacteriales bacterium]
MKRAVLLIVPATAAAVALAGCGSGSSGGNTASVNSGGTTSQIAGCEPSTLHTLKSGVITIGADQPVYEPWYVNNDPTNGKGFEGAVSFAIAKELGYAPSQIKVSRVTFDAAITPGPKSFDYDLDEFSITKAREKAVDFSAPYYDVTQAVVALKGTKAAGVTTLAGLKSLKLAAQLGSTSATAISDTIGTQPATYTSNSDVLQALKNGQVDGVVVDLPTAFYMTSAQLKNGVIVGQLPQTSGQPEQFGALLPKGSPLTSCVSKAVDALRSSGQLAKIQDKWLAQAGNAPVLQ